MATFPRHHGWTVERLVPLLAGTMVLLSVALTLAFSPWWLILTGFVAANLLFYAGWPNVFSAMPVAKDVFEKRPS